MPSTSAAMINELAGNITTECPIWKIISRDGLVAAYAAHTRATVGRLINGAPPFTFGGVTYACAPSQSTRDMHKIGLSPNSTELFGVFDSVITRVDVENGRWKLAKIVYEYVNYLDLSMGSTGKMVGVAGKWVPGDPTYTVEFMSNSSLLQQLIGELTSPIDRNNFPAGVVKATWQSVRNIVSVTDRRTFVVDGTAKPNDYWKYGVIFWNTGANATAPGMEIKSSTGNTIQLQLPMPADIKGPTPGPADQVTMLAGYDGTRNQIRDRFADAIDMNAEPDLPGINKIFTYPE